MKISLLIRPDNDSTLGGMLPGPATYWHAYLLGAPLPNGKRPKLMLPRMISGAPDRQVLTERCMDHLIDFGFKREQINVEVDKPL